MNHRHVLLRQESRIDGTAVTVILCSYVLVTHRMFNYLIIYPDMLTIFSENRSF